MTAKIISGKEIASQVRSDITERAAAFAEKYGKKAGLAVIIVGENAASKIYVRNKEKACEEVGIYSEVHTLPEETTTEELLAKVHELTENDKIHGILVQLPLPKQIDEKKVLDAIPPAKDVDAFHPENTGRIMIGDYNLLPCTPAGIMKMLELENISVDGRHCVVIGRSNIVGKPMAMLLLHANATVTICHSHTPNLAEITRQADVVVVAVGKPNTLTANMIKEGAVVIDVGINRGEDGKIKGDVAFDEVCQKASAVTPVPGGVGAMTITMLLENTLRAAEAAEK